MIDVFVDMDSTMNDFAAGYIKYFNRIYGTKHKLSRKDLFRYEISKCIPGLNDDKALEAKFNIFSTPGFWVDIPIYPGVKKTMKWMNDNLNTYILTAPWFDYEDCVKEKYRWIKHHLPFFPLDKVIFCHDKHVIHNNSILIDDNVKNLHAFKGKVLKINYPYNSDATVDYAAKTWGQVLTVMKYIKKSRSLKS